MVSDLSGALVFFFCSFLLFRTLANLRRIQKNTGTIQEQKKKAGPKHCVRESSVLNELDNVT